MSRKDNAFIRFCFLLMLFFYYNTNKTFAQETLIKGRVIDEHTEEPIPFAGVAILGTSYGTMTDLNGYFEFSAPVKKGDTLTVKVIGYQLWKHSIYPSSQPLVFTVRLKRAEIELPEVVIKPGVDPIKELFSNIIENKRKHDIQRLPAYSVELHTRTEVDLTNITREAFQKYKWLRPFSFIADMIDTTSDVKPFLPVFLVETISRLYYRRRPSTEKEEIIAVKMSGVKNSTITEYLGGLYQDINIFDNWITLFDVDFVSPLSKLGMLYYQYTVTDTFKVLGKRAFKIRFEPRRKGTNTFVGEMIVIDSSFAIYQLSMEKAPWANINWVQRTSIYFKSEPINIDGTIRWMPVKTKLMVDFVPPAEGTIGVMGKRIVTYRDWNLNYETFKGIFALEDQVFIRPNAYDLEDRVWDTLRHEELSKTEKQVYKLVDTIQEIPAFRTYVDIIKTIVSGYYQLGGKLKAIEIGPYFSLISTDEVEGVRVRLGIKTNKYFSRKSQIIVYGAYGFKDGQFKYGGTIKHTFSFKPWSQLGIHAHYDLNLESFRWGEVDKDNLLAFGLKKKGVSQRLLFEKMGKLWYENQMSPSFSSQIEFLHNRITPAFPSSSGENTTEYIITEGVFHLRFAYQEKFVYTKFWRVSLGSKLPVVLFSFYYGMPNIIGSKYQYYHLRLNTYHKFKIKPRMRLYVDITAGKIYGNNVPFPVLGVFEGNYTFFYNPYTYNAMNPYEFLADQYVIVRAEHNFRGLIFDMFPLLRKLKLRTIVQGRLAFGTLSPQNAAYNTYFNYYVAYPVPYAEAGVGIDNIFQLFRVMAIWRLTYRSNPEAYNFGIYAGFNFSF